MSYHSPRSSFEVNSYVASDCMGWDKNQPLNSSWAYNLTTKVINTACFEEFGTCVNYHCPLGTASQIIVIDTLRYFKQKSKNQKIKTKTKQNKKKKKKTKIEKLKKKK